MGERAASATLTWKRGLAGEFVRDNLPTIDSAKHLIRANNRSALTAQLAIWNPEDIMDLMVYLPVRHARRLFDWLPSGPSHKALAELRPEFRAFLMRDATVDRLAQILDGIAVEDAADTFAALPDAVQDRVRPLFANADQIIGARDYPHHTAGQ